MDGFAYSKVRYRGKWGTAGGVHLTQLSVSPSVRNNPSGTRVLTVIPPDTDASRVFVILLKDIMRSMTQDFTMFTADIVLRRVFLDLVGILGDKWRWIHFIAQQQSLLTITTQQTFTLCEPHESAYLWRTFYWVNVENFLFKLFLLLTQVHIPAYYCNDFNYLYFTIILPFGDTTRCERTASLSWRAYYDGNMEWAAIYFRTRTLQGVHYVAFIITPMYCI